MKLTKPTQTRAEIIAALPPAIDTHETYDETDHDNPDGMTPDEMFDAFALGLTPKTRAALYAVGAKARRETVAPTPAPAPQQAATVDVEALARAVAEKLTNADTGASTAKGTTATRDIRYAKPAENSEIPANRPRLTRPVREQRVAEYLAKHKDNPDGASIRAAEEATDIPRTTIEKLTVWRAFVTRRTASRVCEVRTRALTDSLLAAMPDPTSEDPAIIAELHEQEATHWDHMTDEQRNDLVAQQQRDSAEYGYPAEYPPEVFRPDAGTDGDD